LKLVCVGNEDQGGVGCKQATFFFLSEQRYSNILDICNFFVQPKPNKRPKMSKILILTVLSFLLVGAFAQSAVTFTEQQYQTSFQTWSNAYGKTYADQAAYDNAYSNYKGAMDYIANHPDGANSKNKLNYLIL
jgi:hypothetical protein